MNVDREEVLEGEADDAAQAPSHHSSIDVQHFVGDDDTARSPTLSRVHGSTASLHSENSTPQFKTPFTLYSSVEHSTSGVSTLRLNSPFSSQASRNYHMSEEFSLDSTALPPVQFLNEHYAIMDSVSEANAPSIVHSVPPYNVDILSGPREQIDWSPETARLRESSDEISLDEFPFNMRRSDRCEDLSVAQILPDQEDIEPSTLSPTTIAEENNEAAWSGSMTSNEKKTIQGENSQMTESNISWGLDSPTNIPTGWDFTVHEDPPEEAYLSVPTPLEEGFYSQEEDKENAHHQPSYFLDSENSEADDLESEIDWSEVSQRPRDAFGRPLGRDGRPAIPEPMPLRTRELSLRRGRPVLINLLPPEVDDEQEEREEEEIE